MKTKTKEGQFWVWKFPGVRGYMGVSIHRPRWILCAQFAARQTGTVCRTAFVWVFSKEAIPRTYKTAHLIDRKTGKVVDTLDAPKGKA
ncbi:unnamed protein product [marine sediment metagenome]|uniref:Uncharacterized protein n=1 Tax=marine sediment metagenome TaxID=412755 RepID=X0RU14_9ZZZZ